MNSSLTRLALFLLVATGMAGCGNTQSDTSAAANAAAGQWKSQHFDVSAVLPSGWRTSHINTRGDTFDRPEAVVSAFLNISGPYTYILRVENDSTTLQLSTSDYLDAVKTQYESHPAYTLIDEAGVDFHGIDFHRFRFTIVGSERPNAMYAYVHRDPTHLVTIQMTFPINSAESIDVPPTLETFDHGVTIRL